MSLAREYLGRSSNTTLVLVLPAARLQLLRFRLQKDGSSGNGSSVSYRDSMSSDGRFVAFASSATDLVEGVVVFGNSFSVYLRDTCLGAVGGCAPSTVLVSVGNDGTPFSLASSSSISADGRYVAFDGFVNPAANHSVFVRDTCNNGGSGCVPSTTLVSSGYTQAADAGISPDGRFVAFQGVDDTGYQVYMADTCLGASAGCMPAIVLVSAAPDGSPGNGVSGSIGLGTELTPPIVQPAVIRQGGRYVLFGSAATNLVPAGTGGVFIRDTCIGAPSGCVPSTTQVSLANDGSQPNIGVPNQPACGYPSADVRLVVFQSPASNLVANDTNNATDVFLRDTCLNGPQGCVPSTIRLPVGGQPNGASTQPVISGNGLFAAFSSAATNIAAGTPSSGGSFIVPLP
jgi:hypothetical protein